MAEGWTTSFSSGSDIVFDFFCELCIDNDRHVEAEGYCVDCCEYLCGTCYSGHTHTRATRHHVLQDKSNMPKDTPLSTDRVIKDITTKCKVHSDKPVEYYCKSHAVLGCANCFATGHINCSDVESVAQKSKNILGSQWYNDVISKLHNIQKKSRDIEARSCDNKTASLRCYTDVVSMVRQLKEAAIVMLNEFERNTVALAAKMMSEDEEKMKNVEDDCKVLAEKIEQVTYEFERLRTSKRVCQLYVNIRETEDEVKTIHEKLTKLEETNNVRLLTFEPTTELKAFLRNPDALGTISDQCQHIRIPSPVPTINPSSITAKTLTDIRIRSKSDTSNCCIIGSAVVSINRLIITEGNNNKVKLVDTDINTLVSEQKLPSRPCDVTVFNGIQAAVTLPDSNKILIMKVSPSLTKTKEITVRGRCSGIAYIKDRLLVTYVDFPRLEIMDIRGRVIRTFENDSSGSKRFAWPEYVCTSRDGETIYVSDYNRHTVTSLTCDGVVKAVYKDDELIRAMKVCADHHGNVFVCGYLSKNVHVMTADCKKIKVILTKADGLSSCVYSVSHCQDTNRLFIGMSADVVKVYQLA